MLNRSLENLLWENFGRLEQTLKDHRFLRREILSNGFIVYELRKPDPSLPLNGAYFAARKSPSGYIDEALFWYAPDLDKASAGVLKLPMPNEPVGPVKPVEAPQPRRLPELSRLIVAGVAGAGFLFLATQDYIPAFVGFCAGAMIYAAAHNAWNAAFSYVLNAYRFVFPQMPERKTSIKNLEGTFENGAQGREAITMMLELTEISGISR